MRMLIIDGVRVREDEAEALGYTIPDEQPREVDADEQPREVDADEQPREVDADETDGQAGKPKGRTPANKARTTSNK